VSDAEPQLQSNSLGLPDLAFHAVTHIAPTTSVVFIFPGIARQAGPVMPLSFLLTTVVCMLVGSTVFQFSKYVPSSGGYFSFATRGLGRSSGFMATWSYLICEIIGAAAAVGFLGFLVSDTFRVEFHLNIPWWIIASATTVLIWWLTHRGIQLSARIATILGALEVLIMLALGITFLIHPGKGSSYVAPLTPAAAPHHFRGILAGMMFSVLALAGFEARAPLARLPSKSIGQAMMLSLVSIGSFYFFMSYASAVGWGTGDMASFANSANPYHVLGHSLWGTGWWLVIFALINCAVAVGIACTNSASRVMYTMGRAGTVPASFGRIHPIHLTPAVAIGAAQIMGMISILLVGLLLRPDFIFNFLGTVATLAVIIIYVMANLALTQYMRREQRTHFRIWLHVLVPSVATLVLLPVFFVTVYPLPPWPYNLTPYAFLILMITGLTYMYWRELRYPGALDRGAMLIIRGRSDEQGEGRVESASADKKDHEMLQTGR
jgi:amino acid transporter